jgi:hypothetical protein
LGTEAAGEQTRGGKSLDVTVTPADDDAVPNDRPWSGRPDAAILEERFRRDRAGWRRRIAHARLEYDGRDEVAPNERWTT